MLAKPVILIAIRITDFLMGGCFNSLAGIKGKHYTAINTAWNQNDYSYTQNDLTKRRDCDIYHAIIIIKKVDLIFRTIYLFLIRTFE